MKVLPNSRFSTFKGFLAPTFVLRIGLHGIFDVLGVVAGDEPDKSFAEFLEGMGTLFEERWKSLTWRRPEMDSSKCWWPVNPCHADKAQTPKLLSRSLACFGLALLGKMLPSWRAAQGRAKRGDGQQTREGISTHVI